MQLDTLLNKRNAEDVFCRDQHNKSITYSSLRSSVWKLSQAIKNIKEERFAILSDQAPLITLALLACLCAGKTPILLPSIEGRYLVEHDFSFDAVLQGEIEAALPFLNKKIIPFNFVAGQDVQLSFPQKVNDIVLYTSGTTGKSKEVIKPIDSMIREALLLKKFFDQKFSISKNILISGSVTARHLFGLTFTVFYPLIAGCIFFQNRILDTEAIATLKSPYIFISSPAFIKRLDHQLAPVNADLTICAGGNLDSNDAKAFLEQNSSPLLDVYGSTETGIIAYKIRSNSDNKNHWIPFSNIKIEQGENDYILSSPLLDSTLCVKDRINKYADESFDLLGRSDDLIKIEDKRVSLIEIRNALLQLQGIKDAQCLLVQGEHRAYIAALMVAAKEIEGAFLKNRVALITKWRKELQRYLIDAAIPRKFVLTDIILENDMGKRSKSALLGQLGVKD